MAEDSEGRGESGGSNADPLRLVLHTMEEQLDDRVEAVSDAGPSRNESTSDLIKLEETLSSAQDKAKQLVTLRLKLDEEETQSAPGDAKVPSDAPSGSPAPTATEESEPARSSDATDTLPPAG